MSVHGTHLCHIEEYGGRGGPMIYSGDELTSDAEDTIPLEWAEGDEGEDDTYGICTDCGCSCDDLIDGVCGCVDCGCTDCDCDNV